MSYQFYKVLHIFSLALLMTGLITVAVLAATKKLDDKRLKIFGFATHGLGLFLLLLSGFGMAARLQMFQSFPPWLHVKLVFWVLLGLLIALVRRKPQWFHWNILVIFAIITTAAYLVIWKPI